MFGARRTKTLKVILLFVIISFGVRAQERQSRDQDEPIRLNSDLVTVTASATGPNAAAVKTLRAEDFSIYEDGVKQKISHFAATEQPFALLFLLDITGSTQDDIDITKRDARNF